VTLPEISNRTILDDFAMGGYHYWNSPRTKTTSKLPPSEPEGGHPPESQQMRWLLEMDDEAGGDAGAVGVRAGGVEADVVYLGAEGQVRKQADIHAATNAIGKLVG